MLRWTDDLMRFVDAKMVDMISEQMIFIIFDDRLVDDQMMRWRNDPRNFVYAQTIGVITGCGRIGFDLCREDKRNCVTAPHTTSKKDERGNMHMWPMADGVGAKRSMDCVKSALEVSFVWVWNAFRYVKNVHNESVKFEPQLGAQNLSPSLGPKNFCA